MRELCGQEDGAEAAERRKDGWGANVFVRSADQEEKRGNKQGEKKRHRSVSEHLCYNVIGLDVKQVM